MLRRGPGAPDSVTITSQKINQTFSIFFILFRVFLNTSFTSLATVRRFGI